MSASTARAVLGSRTARERAELAMSPAERLSLALELSDLCAELAEAGRGGVGVDILVAHRAWEVAMIAEAAVVPWQGLSLPSVRVEAHQSA